MFFRSSSQRLLIQEIQNDAALSMLLPMEYRQLSYTPPLASYDQLININRGQVKNIHK